ncbi:hypothetical protein NFI96_015024 [Prochilodus magdalenae]|nr:hypothetical protein NFI96_015024 [Prochilodus magdalenae]
MEEWAGIPVTVWAHLVKTYRTRLTSVIANKELPLERLCEMPALRSVDLRSNPVSLSSTQTPQNFTIIT